MLAVGQAESQTLMCMSYSHLQPAFRHRRNIWGKLLSLESVSKLMYKRCPYWIYQSSTICMREFQHLYFFTFGRQSGKLSKASGSGERPNGLAGHGYTIAIGTL